MNWRRSAAVAAGVGVPVLALLSFGLGRDPRAIPSPLPGRPAPAFALEVFEAPAEGAERVGDTVRLGSLGGEVVVVNFWASWCLACRDEHAALSAVAERYRGRGVRFYGVLYNDTRANGRRWIRQMGGQSYPALDDPGARTAIEYGVYGVPETYIIAPDGRVAHKQVGPVTGELLVETIEGLLAGPGKGAS